MIAANSSQLTLFRTSGFICTVAALALIFPAAVFADSDQKAPAAEPLPAGAVEMPSNSRTARSGGQKFSLKIGDEVVGEREYFPESKQLYEDVRMKDGKKHGTRRVWQENGRLFFLEVYREGKLKTVIHWNEAGECCGKSEIVAGFGIVRRYDAAGQLESMCPYRNGVPHGICRIGGTTGSFRDDEYADGKLNGWSRAYREDGLLNWEAQYRDDLLHGVSRKWGNVEDQKQVLLSEEFYIRGRQVPESEYLREGKGSASSASK